MRLYLSSYDIGNQPQKLVELAGSGKRAAVIFNALDHRLESRDKWLASQIQGLNKLGFTAEELDLREYFGKPDELRKFLNDKDLVWVTGGNTFVLRRAMLKSGFDNLIVELLKKDAIAYGGFSAGVVILSASLRGLDIVDDPNDVPAGYDKDILWDGLGLIDFSVAVHYKSDHPESYLIDQVIEYYKNNIIAYKTLRDGEVIVIIA